MCKVDDKLFQKINKKIIEHQSDGIQHAANLNLHGRSIYQQSFNTVCDNRPSTDRMTDGW